MSALTALDEPTAGGAPASLPGGPGRPGFPRAAVTRAVVLPLAITGAAALLPSLVSLSAVVTLQAVLCLVVFATATNLLVGQAGLVSFGQAVFYGTGAYTVALGWLHAHLPFWLLFLAAPVVGAAAAAVMGLICLRARRLYFALLTLAFSQLCYTLAENSSFTLGANGVFGAMVPASLTDPVTGYFFLLAVTVACLLLLWRISTSPFGLVLRALRENRARGEALGVNAYLHQLIAFTISGAFCAVAGAMFAVYSQSAYPDLLDWTTSGNAVLAAVIGGLFTFPGPAAGAVVLQFGQQELAQYTHDWQLALGAVLLAVVLFRPDGLAGMASPAGWRASAVWIRSRLRRPQAPAGKAGQ